MIRKMQVVRRNKPRCLFLALLAGLLLLLATIAAGSGNDQANSRQLLIPQAPNATRRTFALLLGIPQRGPVLGFRNAPVTLQFFGDLQCLDSRLVMLGALPHLIRHWVRSGELQIRYRSIETDTENAGGWYEFREQQGAALAAGQQGKLWNFIDVFYREQGPEFTSYVDEEFLERIAVQAGVDLKAWRGARSPPERWVPQLESEKKLAEAKRLHTTPSFLIGPTGGKAWPLRHFSLEEPQVFDEAVEEILQSA